MLLSECVLILDDSVPYSALTKAFSLIEGTTKRLEKTSILTAFLLLVIQRSGKGSDSLLQSVYLCINKVRSDGAPYSQPSYRELSSVRITSALNSE
jgi:hypothetical protein